MTSVLPALTLPGTTTSDSSLHALQFPSQIKVSKKQPFPQVNGGRRACARTDSLKLPPIHGMYYNITAALILLM